MPSSERSRVARGDVEVRYRVSDVEGRPCVRDDWTADRVIHTYRRGQWQLARKMADKLNEIPTPTKCIQGQF